MYVILITVHFTFQFEKAAMIEQIDIGNDGSAFVEVLVGNSCSTDDFQVCVFIHHYMYVLSKNSLNWHFIYIEFFMYISMIICMS